MPNDFGRRDALVNTVRAALPALQRMPFEDVVCELFYVALDALDNAERLAAVARALTSFLAEQAILYPDADHPCPLPPHDRSGA